MSLSRGQSQGNANQLSPSAIRRLQRDLQAWEKDRADLQIPVALSFEDSNLSTCFINFRPDDGPYKGTTIHIHANFPADYPNSPPVVRMMTPRFHHPNVFANFYGDSGEGAYICLDMIKPPEYYARPYSGWSAAYDLSGLVLQLYSFLIGDDNIDQEWGGSMSRNMYGVAARYLHGSGAASQPELKCRCGFTEVPAIRHPPPAPAPNLQPASASAASPQPQQAASPPTTDAGGGRRNMAAPIVATVAAAAPPPPPVPELPDDIMGLIISKSDTGTVTKIAEARSRGAGGGGGGGAAAAASSSDPTGNGSSGAFTAVDADDPLATIALRVKQDRELVCFYHKTPAAGGGGDGFTTVNHSRGGGAGCRDSNFEEGDVLGFGVAIVRHRDGGLKSLSMTMDLLSYRAFDIDGVRRSAWNVPFDAFIPLALNARHAAAAARVLPRCVARMLGCGSAGVTEDAVLEVMARLMNSLVVEMVAEAPPGSGGGGGASAGPAAAASSGGRNVIARHMSDAALKGFCHLHHLLLTVTLGDGGVGGGRSSGVGALVARCQHDVLRFIAGGSDGGESRHKSRCPDLGLLLIKYMLVPKDVVPWSTFAPVYIRELLARHVMWVARALGDGGNGGGGGGRGRGGGRASGGGGRGSGSGSTAAASAFLTPWRTAAPEPDLWRLETHLKHSRTSLMTVALEAFFVNALARPDGGGDAAAASSGGVSTAVLDQLAAIKATYDKRNGEPPAAIFDAFSRHARSVLSIRKWTELLAALRLGLRPPPPALDGREPTVGDMAHLMADALRQAVLDSRRAGYHTDPHLPSAVAGAGPIAHVPGRYIDWEALPPFGVVSEDWR